MFAFTLTLPRHDETLPGPAPRSALRGVRVLIVDDYEVKRRMLHEQITSWNMRNGGGATPANALATRSRRAIRIRLRSSTTRCPTWMAKRSPIPLRTTALRQTVLVMLTSLGWPGDAARLKEAGIATCLLKPVRQSQPMDALATAWAGHAGTEPARRPAPEAPASSAPRRHARALVVDDNITNQKVASLMLEDLNVCVGLGANGGQRDDRTAAL